MKAAYVFGYSAAVLILASAFLVLVAWSTGSRRVAGLTIELPPMMPVTAIGFVNLGAMLLCMSGPASARRQLFGVAFAAATYLHLMPSAVAPFAGSLSACTAIGFAVLAAGGFVHSSGGTVSPWIFAPVQLSGLLGVIGHAFSAPALHCSFGAAHVGMTWHTSGLLCLAGVAASVLVGGRRQEAGNSASASQ